MRRRFSSPVVKKHLEMGVAFLGYGYIRRGGKLVELDCTGARMQGSLPELLLDQYCGFRGSCISLCTSVIGLSVSVISQ